MSARFVFHIKVQCKDFLKRILFAVLAAETQHTLYRCLKRLGQRYLSGGKMLL